MRNVAWQALAVGALSSLVVVACEKEPGLELRAAQVQAGESVEVGFDRALSNGDTISLRPPPQYWLVLAPEGSPDDYADERVFVERSARSSRVTATRPGRFELRLHSDFPRAPYNVVSRAKVVVEPRALAGN